MKYLFMDALLIRADVEYTLLGHENSSSNRIVEKYNTAVSLDQHKGYFEAMTRDRHPGCTITAITIRVSQNDNNGQQVKDPTTDSRSPLWEVVYPG